MKFFVLSTLISSLILAASCRVVDLSLRQVSYPATVYLSESTSKIPNDTEITGGCWTNDLTVVINCRAQFGGSLVNLTDNPIPKCLYNPSSGFAADDPNIPIAIVAGNQSSTLERWGACNGGVRRNTSAICALASIDAAAKKNAGKAVYEGFGRTLLFGVVGGSALLHLLSTAM